MRFYSETNCGRAIFLTHKIPFFYLAKSTSDSSNDDYNSTEVIFNISTSMATSTAKIFESSSYEADSREDYAYPDLDSDENMELVTNSLNDYDLNETTTSTVETTSKFFELLTTTSKIDTTTFTTTSTTQVPTTSKTTSTTTTQVPPTTTSTTRTTTTTKRDIFISEESGSGSGLHRGKTVTNNFMIFFTILFFLDFDDDEDYD